MQNSGSVHNLIRSYEIDSSKIRTFQEIEHPESTSIVDILDFELKNYPPLASSYYDTDELLFFDTGCFCNDPNDSNYYYVLVPLLMHPIYHCMIYKDNWNVVTGNKSDIRLSNWNLGAFYHYSNVYFADKICLISMLIDSWFVHQNVNPNNPNTYEKVLLSRNLNAFPFVLSNDIYKDYLYNNYGTLNIADGQNKSFLDLCLYNMIDVNSDILEYLNSFTDDSDEIRVNLPTITTNIPNEYNNSSYKISRSLGFYPFMLLRMLKENNSDTVTSSYIINQFNAYSSSVDFQIISKNRSKYTDLQYSDLQLIQTNKWYQDVSNNLIYYDSSNNSFIINSNTSNYLYFTQSEIDSIFNPTS